MSWVVDHEPAVRFGAFIAVFALMAVWRLLALPFTGAGGGYPIGRGPDA